MLAHGQSVYAWTSRLLSGDLNGFVLPEWLPPNLPWIIGRCHDIDVIRDYNVYHDCGKPYCAIQDSLGRHFPDHASVSKKVWLESGGDPVVGRLIGLDMLLHISTVSEVVMEDLGIKDACTLIITAFAEVHSNASMFGGFESTSFKIKHKKLCRNAKALLAKFLPEEIGVSKL